MLKNSNAQNHQSKITNGSIIRRFLIISRRPPNELRHTENGEGGKNPPNRINRIARSVNERA